MQTDKENRAIALQKMLSRLGEIKEELKGEPGNTDAQK